MERLELDLDLTFSRLIYGMWRLADDDNRDVAHVRAKVDACLEQGITTFDQADIYGDYESEAVFGTVLKDAPELRDQMEIISKCGIKLLSDKWPDTTVKHYDTSAQHIIKSVENSLQHMHIEHLDLLLIHRPDPFMDFEDTGPALDALVDSGKVKAVGVSNFKKSDWSSLQSCMENQLIANQIEISLLETSCFTNGDINDIVSDGMTPMAWSPLAGGALFQPEHADLLKKLEVLGADFGVDATAVAIAWLLAHPSKIMPVLGTNNIERIRKLSDAMSVDIDRQTWFELYELANGHEVP